MKVCVFIGPTLSLGDARAELDAVYLSPASQGDVYRAACRKPQAIGIIDGFFECVPAVWHKEILWAMSEGIHVFGCSSMGALRAAELADFGMEGVGKVFEAYREARLEDDDEVAVAHAPASGGYRSLSDAMVNIRATLAAAEHAGIIGRAARKKLERIAKGMPYWERSYAAVMKAASGQLRRREKDGLSRWLPIGQVDQKREDALAMLRLMRARLEAGFGRKQVRFSFQYTANWDVACSRAGVLQLDAQGGGGAMLADHLLDELRMEGESYERTRQAALWRFLALEEARRQGMIPGPERVAATGQLFRRTHGLEEPEAFARWLEANHLGREGFQTLMRDEACLERVRELAEGEAAELAADHLRMRGDYARLAKRAREKQRVLESRGMQNPAAADVGVSEEELLRRYFEERLGRPVATDLAQFWGEAGFEDEGSFRRAILREYCYTGLVRSGSGVG